MSAQSTGRARRPVAPDRPTAHARLHFVVTAGPTREHLDPVRFLSNPSTGRMGFAVARAARAAGHDVTLVAGPVSLKTPKGVDRVDVVSARDMLAAVLDALKVQELKVEGSRPSDQTIKQSNNPRILLVTSSWHMRRAVLMYQKYAPGLEIIPAGTDYEEVVNDCPWQFWQYLPSGQALGRNTELAKELVGYWGYWLLRR